MTAQSSVTVKVVPIAGLRMASATAVVRIPGGGPHVTDHVTAPLKGSAIQTLETVGQTAVKRVMAATRNVLSVRFLQNISIKSIPTILFYEVAEHSHFILELPKLSSRPDVQLDNDGHLTISFNQWTVSQGGSEPVVAYKIQKQQHGTQIWETVFDISHTASVNIAESRITGLLPDTYYRFRIIPLVKDDGHFVDGIPSIPSGFVNTDGKYR